MFFYFSSQDSAPYGVKIHRGTLVSTLSRERLYSNTWLSVVSIRQMLNIDKALDLTDVEGKEVVLLV